MNITIIIEDFIREECEADAFSGEGEAEAVCECDECGRVLHNFDDMTAVLTADGAEILKYCSTCIGMGGRARFIWDLLDSAGLSYYTDWADDALRHAQAEAERRKQAGGKKVLVIQRGVRAGAAG